MPVARFAALHKRDTSLELIDHRLVTGRVPPLGGEVILAARDHDPEAVRKRLGAGRQLAPLVVVEMNIAMKLRRRDPHSQLIFQELEIPMDEVVGPLIALMNQRVVHVQHGHARIALLQRREIGIVLPESIGGSADIGHELTGARRVQIAYGGGEHDDVAWTLARTQNQASHGG